MSKYLSDQNQLTFTYESGAYANTSGAQQWIGMVQDHTVDETENLIPIRYQGSTDRNVDVIEDGNIDNGGAFSFFPQDWKFLGFAIGSVTDTSGAASVHAMTETNNNDSNYAIPTQSLSTFGLVDSKNNGTAGNNFIRTLAGCMVDTMTIKWTQGEVVTCDIDYIAQSDTFTSGAVTAITPSTTKPYMFSDTQFFLPSGTAFDNSSELTLTISNNLERGNYINGSRTSQELLPGNRDLELSATLAMDHTNAMDLYETYFRGGSEFNCMIQSVGAPGSVFIVLSGCRLEMETPSPVEGVNEQSLTIMPQHISASVTDGIAAYNLF